MVLDEDKPHIQQNKVYPTIPKNMFHEIYHHKRF